MLYMKYSTAGHVTERHQRLKIPQWLKSHQGLKFQIWMIFNSSRFLLVKCYASVNLPVSWLILRCNCVITFADIVEV